MITEIILGSIAFVCILTAVILNLVVIRKQTDSSERSRKELTASTVLVVIGFVLLAVALVIAMINATAKILTAGGHAIDSAGKFMADNPEIAELALA